MRNWTKELIEKGPQQLFEEGWKKGLEEGRKEGYLRESARNVLRVLAFRGVQVDEASRQRILACTEPAAFHRWFDTALKATTVSELFEDPSWP